MSPHDDPAHTSWFPTLLGTKNKNYRKTHILICRWTSLPKGCMSQQPYVVVTTVKLVENVETRTPPVFQARQLCPLECVLCLVVTKNIDMWLVL